MKFGGLSEKELQNISDILSEEKIVFEIIKDDEIEEFNTSSMKNNLRHLSAPVISTDMLAITIKDEDFSSMSEACKNKLLAFGITDQPPAPEDFVPHTGHSIHKDLVEGPRRMVAYNLKHQLVAGLVVLVLFLVFKLFFGF